MTDLSERQTQILKAIIEEYIETAQEVGSETLEKKYNLGISPATIRNEMVKLTTAGFLKQIHTSSGRTPTPLALKYYVHELMKPKSLSTTEEVAVKEKIWDYRKEFDKLMREATRELARRSRAMAISTVDGGDLYAAGMGNILEMPEFYDIDLTKTVLSLLDRFDYWQSLVEKAIEGEDPIHILLGTDLGMEMLSPCGFTYTHYQVPPRSGAIGVVGPVRLNYSQIIPLVSYFGNLIEEIGKN
jgi:heat-inducible transcriptional repressor